MGSSTGVSDVSTVTPFFLMGAQILEANTEDFFILSTLGKGTTFTVKQRVDKFWTFSGNSYTMHISLIS